MLRYIIILVIGLCCSLVNGLLAQSYFTKIKKISLEEGLSNRYVHKVFQDSKGFVWIGTKYGLNRYDGYSFQLFTKEKNGLVSNSIHDIHEDSKANLWISYFDARGDCLPKIDILNLESETIISFDEKYKNDTTLRVVDIFDIYQVGAKSIFALTKDKRVFEFMEDGTYRLLFILPCAVHHLHDILVLDDMIWVVCDKGIWEYSRDGKLLLEETIAFKQIMDLYVEETDLYGFAQDEKNNFVRFSKKRNEKLKIISSPSFYGNIKKLNERSQIKLAPNGLIWYSNDSTSLVLNEKGQIIYDFSNQVVNKDIYNIFFDNQNSLWISTSDGVYILTIIPNKFYSYLAQPIIHQVKFPHNISGIVADYKANIYVNSNTDRKYIDLKNENEVTSIQNPIPAANKGAFKDKNGNLWFCGKGGLIECFDPVSETYKIYKCKGVESSQDILYSNTLYQDVTGRIWLGTCSGVYYLDIEHQEFIKYRVYGSPSRLNKSEVYHFCEDVEHQMLWVATSTGIYGYDYQLSIFKYHYYVKANNEYKIPHDYIYFIHKDAKENNIYWVGTKGDGLFKWNPYANVNSVRKHFTVASGLSDNVIYAIIEDEFNNLWISSDYGLMCFNKETYWVNIYLPKDGISNEKFNRGAYLKTASGRFYFGGLNGVNAFYPEDFQIDKTSTTPLHIIEVQQMNGSSGQLEDKTSKLLATNSIVLNSADNFFSVKLALLDYRDPHNNKYAYKIEGIDQRWHFINTNEIRFNKMPAGDYELIIKGQGADGQWSRNQLKIAITIHQVFYKTYPFFIAILILLIIGAYFYINIRIRNSDQQRKNLQIEIKKRTKELFLAKEEAEKSSQAKAEFLSVMSHEIRTPMNAVVNITNFLLQDNPNDSQIENLNILKFSADNLLAIINDVLDFNKIESRKVVFEQIEFDMLRLIDSIQYSMESTAKLKGIQFEVVCKSKLDRFLIGDPSRLTQVLNNLISNAIKFTEKGYVKLLVEVLEETDSDISLHFVVEDTGIGIAEDKQVHIFEMFTQASTDTTRKFGGTGLGLAISQKLINMQGSTIQLKSSLGEGAVFSFELKFGKGALVGVGKPSRRIIEAKDSLLKGTHILVVEDNVINVMVVKKFLQRWGVKITRAADGLEALELLKKQSFELILMDIHMPNMDGYTAAKAIRKMKGNYYKKVPIVALTASALTDDRQKVFDSGMNDIVVKPFIPHELYETLKKYLYKPSANE